jgi:hypothetical protein
MLWPVLRHTDNTCVKQLQPDAALIIQYRNVRYRAEQLDS